MPRSEGTLLARPVRVGVLTAIAVCAVVTLVRMLMAAPAIADQAHAYSTSFGAPGSGDGQLSLAFPRLGRRPFIGGSGLAVNDTTHDIYVADTGNRRVDEFSPAGAFVRAFGAGVGGPGVNVCTSGCVMGTAGSAPGELEAPDFIAVDNSGGPSEGDVYVSTGGREARNGEQHVQINNATGGSFTLTFEGETTTSIAYPATAESVEAALAGLVKLKGNVTVIAEEGKRPGWLIHFVGALAKTKVPQLTVNGAGLVPGTATVEVSTLTEGYTAIPEVISKFSQSGSLIETWGNNGPGESPDGQLVGPPTKHLRPLAGLAVDASGNLWAYDQTATMFEFGQDGNFLTNWSGSGVEPFGIGVNDAKVFYTSFSEFALEELNSDGSMLGIIDSAVEGSEGPFSEITGLVVDPTRGDLYLDEAGTSIGDVSTQCEPSAPANSTLKEGPAVEASAGPCVPTQDFGVGDLKGGGALAVDPVDGTIYALSVGADRVAVFPARIEATIAASSAVSGVGATFHGNVDPEGAVLTGCEFEYGTTRNFGESVPCEESPAAIGSGMSPVPVEAKVSGLAGGMGYYYRLRAVNADLHVSSEYARFTTFPVAVIANVAATGVMAGSVDLTASIDPGGLPATYRFEYGAAACEQGGCASVPVAPEAIGSGTSNVAVAQHVEGLTTGTTYHFRVLATDVNGTTASADHTFVYLPGGPEVAEACSNAQLRVENDSSVLPDCRAYEMVSPAYTAGFRVLLRVTAGIVIGDSLGAFGGTENSPYLEAEYEFARTQSGWVTVPLDPSAAQLPENESVIEAFSSDLRSSVNQYGTSTPFTTTTPVRNFYLREPTGNFTVIGPTAPAGAHTAGVEAEPAVKSAVKGTSSDLSHVLFTSQDQAEGEPFWPADKTFVGAGSLYEYAGQNNTSPTMVAVSGPAGSHTLIGQCGSSLGAGSGGVGESLYNAVSETGETIFFSVAPGGCKGYDPATKKEATGLGPPVDEIYARLHASETVAVSEPTHADCEECQEGTMVGATYLAASADGSRVLFSTKQELLPTDTDFTPDLYEYDFQAPAGHRIVQISAGGTGDQTPGTDANVQGLVAVSPDLSHVYFVAKGVLTGENTVHESPIEGQDNLYVYYPDPANPGQSRTVFIATLAPGVCKATNCSGDAADWQGFTGAPSSTSKTAFAMVTPDGTHLLFSSMAHLTPDDTSAASQLFQYDAVTERFVRISISQDGYNDDGNSNVAVGTGPGGVLGGLQSVDGDHVFFDSTVPLVPQAAAAAGFDSVYEWEPDGVGVCTKVQGCVYLVSDGHDAHTINSEKGSTLAGISPTGTDVYFSTAESLVASDTNSQSSIYDARVDGGFPAPVGAGSCTGEMCQGEPSVAPNEPGPFVFSGPSGNLVSSPLVTIPSGQAARVAGKKTVVKCARGRRLVRGRCVRIKSKRKSHKARKSGSGGSQGNRRVGR